MKRTIYVLDAFTNGHDAALKFIRQKGWKKSECELVFCGSHEALFDRLAEGPGFAVIPVSNTLITRIDSVVDRLQQCREFGYLFSTIGSLKLRVNHCLLVPQFVTSSKELCGVISKAEALAQCGRYLSSIGVDPSKRWSKDSTGAAAKAVSHVRKGSKNVIGAIAPKSAAKAYGLKVIAQGIQDSANNQTTFELLQNEAIVGSARVGIIGIHGKFGKVLESFFCKLGLEVIGSDAGEGKFSTEFVVKNSDVIVFSVPIRKTPSIIRKVIRHVRKDQLLVDVTSVKQPAMRAMLQSRAQVMGLHPMFAPGVPFEGQTIVACPARLTSSYWKTWVVNMLAETGAKIKWTNGAKHDLYMGVVQSQPQSATFVNAALIQEMGISTLESLSFTSPFYRLVFSQMGRLLSHDPNLYADIMMENPVTIPMLQKRLRIERRLIRIIETKDRRAFRRYFAKVRKHFGAGVIGEANELFQRLIAVTKTLYGKNSVILEFKKPDSQPGLLERVLRVFRKRKVNLTGINFAELDADRMQFALTFEQSKRSDSVGRALEEIEGWNAPVIRVVT